MAARPITSSRWVMGILVAALLASVLVVVGLIQITGSSPSSSASSSESPAVDSASATPSPSAGPASTTSAMPSTSGGRSATTPTTTPVELALQVPPTPTASASSGSASASPTTGPAGSASPVTSESTTITPPAGPVTMTLGITPTDVPGLSIYSTTSGRDGTIRWTWSVDAQADPATPGRTLLSATLVDDQPSGGALPPNLLMDSETDLMPCEAGSGVRLPRPLAKGATVTGWISATEASLVVDATTTDGERPWQP